jgi:hypothetical protein
MVGVEKEKGCARRILVRRARTTLEKHSDRSSICGRARCVMLFPNSNMPPPPSAASNLKLRVGGKPEALGIARPTGRAIGNGIGLG